MSAILAHRAFNSSSSTGDEEDRCGSSNDTKASSKSRAILAKSVVWSSVVDSEVDDKLRVLGDLLLPLIFSD